MALSFFAAPLRCLACGALAPDTDATRMQHHLGDEPSQIFRVGDAVPSTPAELEGSFLPVRPVEGDSVHILKAWTCPTCGNRQWAEVVLSGGQIRSIAEVSLSREVLERMNYVDEELAELYLARVGEPMQQEDRVVPDFARRLGEHL
jgi:hypothetical protein